MLLTLLCLVQIINGQSDWYGGLGFSDGKKKLHDKKGLRTSGLVFTRDNANQDEWKLDSSRGDDPKTYHHLDGAFFETRGDRVQRWYVRMDIKWGNYIEIKDEINEIGRSAAYRRNDLVNYGIYMYAGNTHIYQQGKSPEFYVEKQLCNTCTMVAMNNLLQYKYFTGNTFRQNGKPKKRGTWQLELDRQWDLLLKDQQFRQLDTYTDREKRKKHKEDKYTLMKSGVKSTMAEIAVQISIALKHLFGIVIRKIDQHTRGVTQEENADKVTLPTDVTRNAAYMIRTRVIGYLINFELKQKVLNEQGKHTGRWSVYGHWIAIKYFSGTGTNAQVAGWYAWDGSALADNQPLYRADSFDAVYLLVWNYWTQERGLGIDENYLYECIKENEGSDPAQDLIPDSPHGDYYDHYYGKHDENRNVFDDGYKNNGDDLLLLSLLGIGFIETSAIICFCTFGVGGIIGFVYYHLLHRKNNNDENKSDIDDTNV